MMKEKATASATISQWKQNIKEIIHPFPQKGMPQETYAKFYLNDLWFEPPFPENDPDSPMPNGFFTARNVTQTPGRISLDTLSVPWSELWVNDSNSQYPISLTVLAHSNITNVYHSLENSPAKWLILSQYEAYSGQPLFFTFGEYLKQEEEMRGQPLSRSFSKSQRLPTKIIKNFISSLYEKAISDEKFLEHLDSVPFQFSLCNPASVQLDSVLAQADFSDVSEIEYRPYLYEFQGQARSFFHSSVSLSSRFSILDLINMVTDGTNALYCTLFHHDDLHLAEQMTGNANDLLAVLDGTITFSASPIADEPGYLAIFKRKIEKNELSPEEKARFDAVLDDTIYKCCNTFSATNMAEKAVHNAIQNALSLTAGVVPTNAVIHNVGQGNNILIELSNGRKLFYDLGMTMDKDERNDPYIQQSIRQFRTISPDMIVLSHWDLDHILGISYADDSIYNALWVVPDLWALCRYRHKKKLTYRFVSDFAKRLYKFLDCLNNDKLLIIDSTWCQSKIFPNLVTSSTGSDASEPNQGNEALQIWSGTCQYASGKNAADQGYTITPANNWGLILSLKNTKRMLLPGDCEYKKMPPAVRDLSKYNLYIASHHCSRMSSPKISASSSIRGQNAYLLFGASAGSHNKYHHPDSVHREALANRFKLINANETDVIRCSLK